MQPLKAPFLYICGSTCLAWVQEIWSITASFHHHHHPRPPPVQISSYIKQEAPLAPHSDGLCLYAVCLTRTASLCSRCLSLLFFLFPSILLSPPPVSDQPYRDPPLPPHLAVVVSNQSVCTHLEDQNRLLHLAFSSSWRFLCFARERDQRPHGT